MDHSIFALEICARMDKAPELHTNLLQRIRAHPAKVGLQDKWEFYRGCADVLLATLGDAERGCWDFFDEDARAQRDYKMWCQGMTGEETARTTPSGAPDPYRGEPRYLAFTISLLLVQGSYAERSLAALCDIPEPLLWRRETFARILRGLGGLSFASVKSDVVYLIPRDPGWSLTLQDLQDPKFEYLRMLEG